MARLMVRVVRKIPLLGYRHPADADLGRSRGDLVVQTEFAAVCTYGDRGGDTGIQIGRCNGAGAGADSSGKIRRDSSAYEAFFGSLDQARPGGILELDLQAKELSGTRRR